jgi:Domain of unknown function (DUF4332)
MAQAEAGQMDREAFARFLRGSGKKAHVVDGLIGQVERFQTYLASERRKGLDAADAGDLEDYLASLEAQKPGQSRKHARGLALYYRFTGNAALAGLASGMREQGIVKTRKAFLLRDFLGVNQDDIAKMAAAGISNVEQMLEAGKTPAARQRLASETSVSPGVILELVKLSDLSRVEGVKGIRARLYYDAGADTLEKIAQWEPEALRMMLNEFVQRTGFAGIAPLPKEVIHTVARARQLPKIVTY